MTRSYVWDLEIPWSLVFGAWDLELRPEPSKYNYASPLMPLFQYRALQADGVVAEGQLEAAGRQEAFRQMEGLGLRPVSLAESAAEAAEKGLALPASRESKFPCRE